MVRALRPLMLLLLLATLLTPVVGAQEPVGGVTLQIQAPYGTLYRPYAWLPLFATVANEGADRMVELRYGHFATQIELPRGARKEVALYVRPEMASKLKIVVTSDGQELANATIKTQSTIRPVVGVVGTVAAKPRGLDLVALTPKLVADRPQGFDVLDALVLDGKQRIELSAEQWRAIAAWVGAGGKLLITGGAAVEDLLAKLPADMRPATAQANDSAEVATTALANFAGRTDDPGSVSAIRLLPEDGSQIMAVGPDGRPLLVRRLSGGGMIVALAVPLDAQALTTWAGMEKLWAQLVPQRQALPGWDPSFGVEQQRDQHAPGALLNLPALDLPPIQWLLVLLGIYILLAGPVSYVVLRRLDRQAWGWVTIPALTLFFAALAFGIGAQNRGSNLILNQIAIVEQGSGATAQVHNYVGIFSPVRAEYTFKLPDGAVARPISSDPFGGNPQLTNALFVQNPSQIQSLKINQWSMEMLAFESLIDWRGLETSLAMEGTSITGSVINRSPNLIHNVMLVVGQDVIKLGDMQAGQEVEVNRKVFGGMIPQPEMLSYMVFRDEFQRASGELPRELRLRQSALDIAAPMPGSTDTRPYLIGWLDQAPVAVDPQDERSSYRQTTLLLARPRLAFSSDEVKIDSRWMQLVSMDGGNMGSCGDPMMGPSMSVQVGTTEMALSLPPEAQGLKPSSIFIRTLIEGDGPKAADDVKVEVLDWQSGELVEVSGKGNKLENPERFLTPGGEIQFSVTVPANIFANNPGFFGCVRPSVEITGRLS